MTIGAFLAMDLCIGVFQGPMFSTLHALLPSQGRTTALLILIGTIAGLGTGPFSTGAVPDSSGGRAVY